MEGHVARFALLMCIMAAASATCQTCDPGNADNPWIHLREMQTGCWTSFIGEDNAEVHIFNLNYNIMDTKMFSLEMTSAKPVNLILTSPYVAFGACNIGTNVNIYVNSNSTIALHGIHHNLHKQDFPTQDEELVEWAKQKFGGVTSFTTILNLQRVSLMANNGTKPGPRDCVLQNEDAFEKFFMKIEATPLASSLKSCSPQQQNPSDETELHIINIPESASICNVSIRVDSEKKTSVFVRGPKGTTWTFLNSQHTQFGSNNDILLPAMTHRILPSLVLNNDSTKTVQREALNYFKSSTFTSYTELIPGSSMILLVLTKKEGPAVTGAIPEPVIPITTNAPHQMPLQMQLYTSPDYRSPLGPNTKVQSDKRIYAEISGHTFGDIALTIKVINCFVHSKGSCTVVKELPFIPETCSLNSCPNSTRLSFSLDQLQELTPTTWDLECSVKLCYSEKCGDGGRVKRNLQVTQPCLQSPRKESCNV
uniref:endoglin isoform X2 n=1 Tax=Scatophagus argus TaxID=75038 RepID=UPI001ED7FED0|nr:endoglin isoform X2 [Scatophagus argus]